MASLTLHGPPLRRERVRIYSSVRNRSFMFLLLLTQQEHLLELSADIYSKRYNQEVIRKRIGSTHILSICCRSHVDLKSISTILVLFEQDSVLCVYSWDMRRTHGRTSEVQPSPQPRDRLSRTIRVQLWKMNWLWFNEYGFERILKESSSSKAMLRALKLTRIWCPTEERYLLSVRASSGKTKERRSSQTGLNHPTDSQGFDIVHVIIRCVASRSRGLMLWTVTVTSHQEQPSSTSLQLLNSHSDLPPTRWKSRIQSSCKNQMSSPRRLLFWLLGAGFYPDNLHDTVALLFEVWTH